MYTNHQNFSTEEGKVYCKKLNKIVNLDNNLGVCSSCEYLVGSLQGDGVECAWDDGSSNSPIVGVTNPEKELLRVSKLKDSFKKSLVIEL